MTLSLDETSSSQSEKKVNTEAVKTNLKIEERLRRDKALWKKQDEGMVKVLLLGQAGSGKSTTLKNFRIKYAKEEWEQERLGWRTIIQLNVVRQVLTILEIIQSELDGDGFSDTSDTSGDEGQSSIVGRHPLSDPTSREPSPEPMSPVSQTTPTPKDAHRKIYFTEQHLQYVTQFAPLHEAEQELKSRIHSYDVYYPNMTMVATPFDADEPIDDITLVRKKVVEYSVRSWKDVMLAAPAPISASSGTTDKSSPKTTSIDQLSKSRNGSHGLSVDRPTRIIAKLREQIKQLWADRVVRAAVRQRRSDIPDATGIDANGESSFLDDIDRIASIDYQVTDSDIMYARLRTVGIQEYVMQMESVFGGRSWRVYDVGGCRTMRKAWLPYFENVHAIIFLSPVSVFDEWLEEDPRVNRLQDSTILWTSICETPLLSNTQLILFLNKCDILQRKLRRGIQVRKYLSSYGNRPNEVRSVVRYMKEKFKSIHKDKSINDRSLFIYPTTAIDSTATGLTLDSVRAGILRSNLVASHLL